MNWNNIKFTDIFAAIGFGVIMAFFFYVAHMAAIGKQLDANVGGIVTGLMTLLVMAYNHYFKADKKPPDKS